MILALGPRSGLVLVAAVRLGIAERQSGAGLNVCACSEPGRGKVTLLFPPSTLRVIYKAYSSSFEWLRLAVTNGAHQAAKTKWHPCACTARAQLEGALALLR